MTTTLELGRRIEGARRRRGWTQADAAAACGLSRATWIATEKGERRPDAAELVRLAEALSVPIADLLHADRPTASPAPRFRKLAASASIDMATFIDEAIRLASHYAHLERLLGLRPPPAPLDDIRTWQAQPGDTYAEAEVAGRAAARFLRHVLGLGDGPAHQLETLLEGAAGLRLFHLAMPSTISGFFFHDPQLGSTVVLNANHPTARRRFSLAHEVGHFLRDRERGDLLDADAAHGRRDASEVFSDTVAIELLAPAEAFAASHSERKHAGGGRFTVADLVALSDDWEISFEMGVRRLEQLGCVPKGTLDKLRSRGIRPAEVRAVAGLAATPKPSPPPKLPRRYQHLTFAAYERELISEMEMAEYLDIPLIDARDRYRAQASVALDDGRSLDAMLDTDLARAELG